MRSWTTDWTLLRLLDAIGEGKLQKRQSFLEIAQHA